MTRSTNTFGQLSNVLAKSKAVRSLSHGSFRVLFGMAAQYRGKGTNNGAIVITLSAMQEYGVQSSDTVWRAEKQLREHGLIVLTKRGNRHEPNLYALTWLPIDKCGHDIPATTRASHLWKHYDGPTGPSLEAREPPSSKLLPE
jgi:hypothetical protein